MMKTAIVLVALAATASASVFSATKTRFDLQAAKAKVAGSMLETLEMSQTLPFEKMMQTGLFNEEGQIVEARRQQISQKCFNAANKLSSDAQCSFLFGSNSLDILTEVEPLCEGGCLDKFEDFFRACEDDLVGDYDYFSVDSILEIFRIMDTLLCFEDSAGDLCWPQMVDPATGQFYFDAISSDSEAVPTEAEMDNICTECFYQYIKQMSIAFTPTDDDEGSFASEESAQLILLLGGICMKDPVIDEYCLIFVEETLDEDDCEALPTFNEQAACIATMSERVCSTSNCHARQLAVWMAFDPELTQDEIDDVNLALSYLCTRHADGDYCAEKWFHEELIDWEAEYGCSDITSGCAGNEACQNATDAYFDRMGCCHTTGFEIARGVGEPQDAAIINAWDATLRQASCNAGTVRSVPGCARYETDTTSAVSMITDLSCDFFDEDSTAAADALRADLAISLGLAEDDVADFVADCGNGNSRRNNKVLTATANIKSNNDPRTTLVSDVAAALPPTGWYTGKSVEAAAPFAKEKALNAAAGALPSLLLVAATAVALAMAF